MVSRRELEEYGAANNGIVAMAQKDLADFWKLLDTSNPFEVKAAMLEFMPELVTAYGESAAVLAADFYDSVRPEGLPPFRAVMAETPPIDQIESVTRYNLDPVFKGDPDSALNNLANAAQRLVNQPGRQTIESSVEKDPSKAGWARVPVGSVTCSFCRMLASRGAVYSSKRAAGYGMNRYHNNCDCKAVPVWSEADYPQGYDPEALYEEYAQAHEPGMTTKETLKAMREQDGEFASAVVAAKLIPSSVSSHLERFGSYIAPDIDGDDDEILAGVMADMPPGSWSNENAQIKAALFIGDNSNALRNTANRLGVDESTVMRKANAAVQSVVDASPFAVKISDDKLASVLSEGRFKSLFETGSSGGNTNQKLRSGLEEALFGYRDDSPADTRPIYGFVDVPTKGSRLIDKDTYGGVKVRLKESVRNRATVTVGDSIDARYVTAPSPATDIRGFTGRVSQIESADQDYGKFLSSGDFHEHDYIEAQFHGGLGVEDIESVVLKSEPGGALREALDVSGIPWTIEG